LAGIAVLGAAKAHADSNVKAARIEKGFILPSVAQNLPSPVELVVARYGENLNWMRRVPSPIRRTVYDKNPDFPAPDAIRLPNVGREAHSYLHHIVSRYDNLSAVSVFCQGHPFDHAFDFHASLRELASHPEAIPAFAWLGHIVDTDDARGHTLFRGWSKNDDGRELDMNGFHRALFDCDDPPFYTFRLGAQFAVSHSVLRARPLDFWRRALDVSIEFPDAAHCFERSWDRVVGIIAPDAVWLNGRTTAYLKPIRRLENP